MGNDVGEKFFTGLIVGTILGLVIGIFNAPRSGEESRKLVKAKFDELGKKFKHESESSDV